MKRIFTCTLVYLYLHNCTLWSLHGQVSNILESEITEDWRPCMRDRAYHMYHVYFYGIGNLVQDVTFYHGDFLPFFFKYNINIIYFNAQLFDYTCYLPWILIHSTFAVQFAKHFATFFRTKTWFRSRKDEEASSCY